MKSLQIENIVNIQSNLQNEPTDKGANCMEPTVFVSSFSLFCIVCKTELAF